MSNTTKVEMTKVAVAFSKIIELTDREAFDIIQRGKIPDPPAGSAKDHMHALMGALMGEIPQDVQMDELIEFSKERICGLLDSLLDGGEW